MSLKNEERILRELNELKWADGQFICVKCGNKNYNKGEETYSRRCSNSKCKRDVTFKKYTAFEGLRFPIEKAYGILETIVSRASLDPHKKVIKVKLGWGVKYLDNDFLEEDKLMGDKTELISLLEYKKRAEATHTGANVLNEKLQQLTSAYLPSIGRLAKKFELEENTVLKFILKIRHRIKADYRGSSDSFIGEIVDYINYNQQKRTLSHLLGMAMVPLVGEWKYGLKKIKGKAYGIKPIDENEGPWAIYRITGTHDGHTYKYTYHEEVSYGSDEWYDLFGENVPLKK